MVRQNNYEKEMVFYILSYNFKGKVGDLPSVDVGGTIIKETEPAAAASADVDSEEDEMERRLQALRT